MKSRSAYIFPACLLIIISCSRPDERKCAKLKQGEFYYKGKAYLEGSNITRNDSVQVVTDEKTGEKLKEKIVWIEPCAYVLYPLPDNKPDILNSQSFPITVSILEVTSKYYTVHVVSGDKKTDFNDTAWIVPDEAR